MKKITYLFAFIMFAGCLYLGLPSLIATAQSPVVVEIENITGNQNISDNFNTYIKAIYELILVVAVMLAFLYLIWGGVEYINPLSSKDTAKQRIQNALIGLMIVLGTYFLLNLINPDIFKINLFGKASTPPTQQPIPWQRVQWPPTP